MAQYYYTKYSAGRGYKEPTWIDNIYEISVLDWRYKGYSFDSINGQFIGTSDYWRGSEMVYTGSIGYFIANGRAHV